MGLLFSKIDKVMDRAHLGGRAGRSELLFLNKVRLDNSLDS